MPTLNDPVLIFTLLALVMLVMPLVAERLRVPDLVLLLLAGLVLGPHGIGLLARNSAITLFGSVGLLYIMFLAGLEIDLHRFARTRLQSVAFGLLTFAIPQCLGTWAGLYLLGFNWPTSLLLASLFASHTLLAYPIASRLGIARSEPVAVTVGATIITDTLALLVLAVIADTARGISLGFVFWAHLAAGLACLFALAWWGIPRLTHWFFQRVPEAGGSQFMFVLVTVCGFAYLSHFAKMEPIIGAFLAGAAFSRLIPENSALMNRIVFSGNTLFIPFFLLSVGMLIDPATLLRNPRSWAVAAVMVLLVITTKFVAAWLAGRLFGYSRDARRVMFGLSVVQAAATLAAVLVGYNLKIFDDTVLNGAIAMIVVTCPLGAWLVERHGRALAAETRPAERAVQTAQRLLIPVVNPAFAIKLMDLAFLLRNPAVPGSLTPLTIVREEDDIEEALTRGEKLLADCLTHAAAANMAAQPAVRVAVNASDGIARAAKELRASLVVTGWGGERSANVRLFGSVMERLIDGCSSRLLFARLRRPLNTTRRVLLPLPPLAEHSAGFDSLLLDAKHLARQVGAELRVYASAESRPLLLMRLDALSPAVPRSFAEAAGWPGARERLLAEAGPDDLLFAFGERRVSAYWSPLLDKLCALLVARFPDNNLLLAFPALTTEDEAEAGELEAATPADDLRLCACELGAETRLSRALHLMTATAFPHAPATVAEARRLLVACSRSYPSELAAGTVLFHAHCETIASPVLIVGKGDSAWPIVGQEQPSRVLLALLNPAGRSPEFHLKILAGLARRFRDAATVERVGQAASAAAVADVLSQPATQKENHA
jgi:Kef-type K+ transport system membrane component KefB/mannitol/fructose-specific phosphotransferase system IIA component (Ntr-type)